MPMRRFARRGRPRKPIVPLTEAERDKVEAALPMLNAIAGSMRRCMPSFVEHGDLVQWGMLGLADAVRRFDESRGVAFATYANVRVRGAILDGIRSMDWMPRTDRARARSDGRHLVKTHSLARKCFEADSGRDVCEGHMLADAKALPPATDAERRDYFDRVTRGLGPREATVVKLMYLHGCNMREAGNAIGISETRVSQLHSQAIGVLKSRAARGELPCLAGRAT